MGCREPFGEAESSPPAAGASGEAASTSNKTNLSIYINGIVGVSVCLSVCLFPLNLRSLKSHDHETWHVGPLSDVDVHGLSGILIFGRVAPQVLAA